MPGVCECVCVRECAIVCVCLEECGSSCRLFSKRIKMSLKLLKIKCTKYFHGKFIARCQQQQQQQNEQQQQWQQQQQQQQYFAAAFYRLFVVLQRATLQLATLPPRCLAACSLVDLWFCFALLLPALAACHSCCCCHGHHLLICMQFIFLSAIFIVLPAVDFLLALHIFGYLPHCLTV